MSKTDENILQLRYSVPSMLIYIAIYTQSQKKRTVESGVSFAEECR